MRVFVTGVTGQLGEDVCRTLRARGVTHIGVSSQEMDLTDPAAVKRILAGWGPDAVIHCAAWTDVDGAEHCPEQAMAVNRDGTEAVVQMCRELNATMLYVSTDYVFPGKGDRPYRTGDRTAPLNVYGCSKLAGETEVRNCLERYFIVRTSWLYGQNGRNFISKVLELPSRQTELSVVGDQIGSPTYTADLAPLLCDMIGTERYGIYHAVNEGVCSRADFARQILRLAGWDTPIREVRTEQFPSPAARPLNSRLDTAGLEENGFCRLPPWQDALVRYFHDGAQP